jgi:hypothetical protein
MGVLLACGGCGVGQPRAFFFKTQAKWTVSARRRCRACVGVGGGIPSTAPTRGGDRLRH